MAFHARLSPSAAHRWMNCAGSVALIGDEPNAAGLPAMMGTAAHKVIETMIQGGESDAAAYLNSVILVHGPGEQETVIHPAGSTPTVLADWYQFICDDIMVAGVQMFMDEHFRIINDLCFDPVIYSERYLDMTWLDDRLGGTADDTIADPDWIHLLDYKNGRVLVEVKGNEQMKNYAVGLLHEHPEARGVTVHLVQPNSYHEDGFIREESYSADELKLFEIQMKEAADATAKPNAPRRVGSWCTYCPGKVRCPEFEAAAREECQMDFASDPVEGQSIPVSDVGNTFLDDDDDGVAYRAALSRRRKWIPMLAAWIRDVNKAVFAELMNGREVPDAKLVQGKSNRAYVADEITTANALIEAGLPNDQLWTEPKLKSPAQVEKIRPVGMKPAAIKAIVAGVAHKPPGRITIADADDPREAIDPAGAAAADFADDPADEQEGDFG